MYILHDWEKESFDVMNFQEYLLIFSVYHPNALLVINDCSLTPHKVATTKQTTNVTCDYESYLLNMHGRFT